MSIYKIGPKEVVDGWTITPTFDMTTGNVVSEYATKPIDTEIIAKMPKIKESNEVNSLWSYLISWFYSLLKH